LEDAPKKGMGKVTYSRITPGTSDHLASHDEGCRHDPITPTGPTAHLDSSHPAEVVPIETSRVSDSTCSGGAAAMGVSGNSFYASDLLKRFALDVSSSSLAGAKSDIGSL